MEAPGPFGIGSRPILCLPRVLSQLTQILNQNVKNGKTLKDDEICHLYRATGSVAFTDEEQRIFLNNNGVRCYR